MSDYGTFESLETSAHEQKVAAQASQLELDHAIHAVRERFGDFFSAATSLRDFNDRVAMVKPDLIKVVADYLLPRPAVVRKVVGAQKTDRIRQARDFTNVSDDDLVREYDSYPEHVEGDHVTPFLELEDEVVRRNLTNYTPVETQPKDAAVRQADDRSSVEWLNDLDNRGSAGGASADARDPYHDRDYGDELDRAEHRSNRTADTSHDPAHLPDRFDDEGDSTDLDTPAEATQPKGAAHTADTSHDPAHLPDDFDDEGGSTDLDTPPEDTSPHEATRKTAAPEWSLWPGGPGEWQGLETTDGQYMAEVHIYGDAGPSGNMGTGTCTWSISKVEGTWNFTEVERSPQEYAKVRDAQEAATEALRKYGPIGPINAARTAAWDPRAIPAGSTLVHKNEQHGKVYVSTGEVGNSGMSGEGTLCFLRHDPSVRLVIPTDTLRNYIVTLGGGSTSLLGPENDPPSLGESVSLGNKRTAGYQYSNWRTEGPRALENGNSETFEEYVDATYPDQNPRAQIEHIGTGAGWGDSYVTIWGSDGQVHAEYSEDWADYSGTPEQVRSFIRENVDSVIQELYSLQGPGEGQLSLWSARQQAARDFPELYRTAEERPHEIDPPLSGTDAQEVDDESESLQPNAVETQPRDAMRQWAARDFGEALTGPF